MNALRHYLDQERGRITKMANDMDVTPGAVWQWAETQVPAERVFKIAAITGIPVERLRPDMMPSTQDVVS